MSCDFHKTATFEPLEPRLLMNGTLSVPYLARTAQALNVGPVGTVAITDTIAATGQVDVYKFRARADGRLNIDMKAKESQINPFLQVVSDTGRLLRWNNDATGDSPDSSISLGVRMGRTYYVRSFGAGGTCGEYELEVTSNAFDDYGNAFATARNIALEASRARTVRGNINYPSDVDVLSFAAPTTGTTVIYATSVGRWNWPGRRRRRANYPSYRLLIYDAEGTLLTHRSVARGRRRSRVGFYVDSGETYYIKTRGTASGRGRYRLRVVPSRPQPSPDTPEGDFTPGEAVAAQVLATEGGQHLVVLGTDAADSIALSQDAGGVTVTSSAGSEVYCGDFQGVTVYGFSGDDTIRLTNSVSVGSFVHAGEGDDDVYDASTGAGVIQGGGGNDLLITVGGGRDVLRGQSGLDSFWCDTGDVVADAAAAEKAIRSVHKISSFYQPYSSDPSSKYYVSLEIAGQDLRDPTCTFYARGYDNFADVPLFADGAQYDDIAQGAVGDCYYLAVLSSLADTDPRVVEQMIAPLGDGTYAVRFYRAGRAHYVRVDADLPVFSNGSPAYAKLGPDGELWVPLAEKAYAHFRYRMNSYSSLSGGWMSTVNQEVANASSLFCWIGGGLSAASLTTYFRSHLAAGHAITLGSNYNATGPIVGGHAYTVKSVRTADSQTYVTVYNPWGIDGRSWDSNSGDGLLEISIGSVQRNFQAAVVCRA